MKKFFGFLVMFLVVFCCFGCNKGYDNTKDNVDTIKLGSSGPLSGEASIYGISVEKGIKLAIEEINKEGIKLGDKTYTFELVEFYNDEADPDKASSNLTKLFDAGTDVVVGAVTSGATEGLIGQAIKVGIPVITPTGTADKLTVGESGQERDDRYNVFRACFYDSYQGKYMAEYAASNGIKKAYVLYNNSSDYSVGCKDSFETTAKAKGLEVTTAAYGEKDKNFSAFVAPIVSGSYDCVYISDYYENVYNILTTLYGAGYTGVCYGGDGWDGVIQQVKAGDDASFLEKCFYTNHYFGASESPAVKKFVDAYKAKYDGETPVSFAALAYDAVYIVKQAIEQAQSFKFDDVINALAEGSFTGLVTSAKEFKFDENGNPQKDAVIITFKDGKEVEAK